MEQAHYQQQYQDRSNPMGTAAMVLGIIALILSIIPIIGFISWILAPLAIIFGIIGLNKAGAGRGSAIAGLATGGVALLICIAWATLWTAAVNEAVRNGQVTRSSYSN
jgi:Mg2+ and Co2+ transporter CorA